MFTRILVPLDGSTFAEAALPWAVSIARRSGATLHLASVAEDEQAFPDRDWASAARGWAGEYLTSAVERVRAATGGSAEGAVLDGRVADTLAGHGRALGADLVVMATHGRGMVSRAWLGSVADAYVRQAEQPVLLVRPPEGASPAPESDQTISRILVAEDGSERSRSVLGPAADLAHIFQARLRLLHVVPVPTELVSPYLPYSVPVDLDLLEETRSAAARSAEALAESLRARGLEVEAEAVVDPQIAPAILRRAEEASCALLALATHGRSGLSRFLLGSTTDKVIRGTTRPVLVVRAPEEG